MVISGRNINRKENNLQTAGLEEKITFLIPANKRNLSDEKIIKKQLIEHFNKEFKHLNKQRRKIYYYCNEAGGLFLFWKGQV